MRKIIFNMPFLRTGRLALLPVLFVLASCTVSFTASDAKNSSEWESFSATIKVMNWNLQTFFDGIFDGNEYSDYKSPKSGWSSDKYEERLERLCSVIREMDADVIIMEELEKEAQLQDIANRLSGTFDFSSLYKHGLFARDEGSSIGCGILSRLPIDSVSVHSLDVRTEGKAPSMRPVIQFSLSSKGKSLTIFANHWKSKSSGEAESEIWRKRQEALLARLIKKAGYSGQAILACGDFNKDILEFDIKEKNGEKSNLILHGKDDVEVYSPWICENGSLANPGSYWYKNQWERIDHFFAAGKIEVKDFYAESIGEWADKQGHPLRYQIWNGKGYSDHLPITCTVCF